MLNGLPDGWLSCDALTFGEGVREGGVLSRGAKITLPDMRTCGTDTIWNIYHGWSALIDSLGDNEALQLQWQVSSDYSDFQEAYAAETERTKGTAWTRFVRENGSEQMRELMNRGLLRREHLSIYLGRKMAGLRGVRDPAALADYVRRESENLNLRINGWGGYFAGGGLQVMGNQEHGDAWEAFLNPGRVVDQAARSRHYDPELSLQEQCLHAGFLEENERGECYFKHDGYYHALLVLRRWPTRPTMGLMTRLTSALEGNYSITFNIYTISVPQAIKDAEKEALRLEQDSRIEKSRSMLVKSGQREERARQLSSGNFKAFKVLPVLRVWAPTVDRVRTQVGLLKNTLAAMSGIQYFQVDHGEQFRQLFAETLPGYLEGKYRDWDIYGQSDFLPTVLPISTSFDGCGPCGQAVYFGDQGNLVGVRGFADNGTPLQTTILGMRGAGKSTWEVNLVSQLAPLCGSRIHGVNASPGRAELGDFTERSRDAELSGYLRRASHGGSYRRSDFTGVGHGRWTIGRRKNRASPIHAQAIRDPALH